MKPKLHERGQALVIIALAVVGLFGFSALAIDGSRVFSDRRHAQNAADTAALAAALAQVRGDDYVLAGKERAASNGYEDDADSLVEVNLCSAAGLNPPCEGLPGDAHPSEFIQVKIVSTIPATFARILGRTNFTNVLTAVARTRGAKPSPLARGNALAAMSPDEKDAIFGGGNVNLQVNGSGVFSNSNWTDPACNHGAMRTAGTGVYEVETAFETVGSFCPGGVTTIVGPWQQTQPIPYPPEINIPIPNFSCSGPVKTTPAPDASGVIAFTPGNYDKIIINTTAKVHFNPGTYCIGNGLQVNGQADVISNEVRFLFTGGAFKINAGTWTCNDVIVHINGGSGLDFTGGSVYCNNVTFIASTGNINWNGVSETRMFARTGGDYKGVLIYLPVSNNKAAGGNVQIEGSANSQLTGSIIAPGAPIKITGNNWTDGLNTQIIGYTVELRGTGDLVINYNPEDQYLQVDPSAIQLTK